MEMYDRIILKHHTYIECKTIDYTYVIDSLIAKRSITHFNQVYGIIYSLLRWIRTLLKLIDTYYIGWKHM